MSLNKILRGFNKTLRELEALVKRNDEGIQTRFERVSQLVNESGKLLQEKRQALLVIDKLKDLTGDK